VYALRAKKVQWQLGVYGQSALKLLPNIGFRHREKIVGRQIATTQHRSPWGIAGPLYAAHRRAILVERSALEVIAAKRYSLRDDRRQRKSEIFRERVESAYELFSRGLRVEEVARILNCSARTAYRRKVKFRESRTVRNHDDSTYP
jgi:hypothetical protein